eukprot:6277879-Pyramimonas_sp.AAC.1
MQYQADTPGPYSGSTRQRFQGAARIAWAQQGSAHSGELLVAEPIVAEPIVAEPIVAEPIVASKVRAAAAAAQVVSGPQLALGPPHMLHPAECAHTFVSSTPQPVGRQLPECVAEGVLVATCVSSH